jgi:acyl dehydratase
MLTIPAVHELPGLIGSELGTSDWHEVTQEQVNQFADATGDHQWIHVDPERAAAGPFGGTIAHGYLTLSLIPVLLSGAVRVEGTRMGINYGLNKVRFPAPVRSRLTRPRHRRAQGGQRDPWRGAGSVRGDGPG